MSKKRARKEPKIRPCLPALFYEEQLVVPLKMDMTFNGARFVDTCVWKLYNSCITPMEYSCRISADLNLPAGFTHRIALQIEEQLRSYRKIVEELFAIDKDISDNSTLYSNWIDKLEELQSINIGIRINTLEYQDKLLLNATDSTITPEKFARQTCAELGLPSDIESSIAHKIREHIFRMMIQWIENYYASNSVNVPSAASNTSSSNSVPANPPNPLATKADDLRIALLTPYSVTDQLSSLWKKARPNTSDDLNFVAYAYLPDSAVSNSVMWNSK